MSAQTFASDPMTLEKIVLPEMLIFVRHGQTDWNAEGRMQGHIDIPLNATGEGQATANGKRLKVFLAKENLGIEQFDFIASPLGRTQKTMQLLRSALGLAPEQYALDDRLKELTFGRWEGHRFEELNQEEPELVAQRRADKWRFVPPAGESYQMGAERVAPWLKTLTRPTVVVAHGGVYRIVRGLLEGLDTKTVPSLEAPQDRVFVWRNNAFETV